MSDATPAAPRAEQPDPAQSGLGDNALPADIRQQVEQEQALADAQKRLKQLEEDNERLKKEKKEGEDARDGAGQSTLFRIRQVELTSLQYLRQASFAHSSANCKRLTIPLPPS